MEIFNKNKVFNVQTSRYSNVTGNDLVDTTELDILKKQLSDARKKLVETEDLIVEHTRYYNENLQEVNMGRGAMENVNIEAGRISNYNGTKTALQATIKNLVENKIPEEQKKVDAAIELQIRLLSEKAKSDPNALAQLKEIEAQKASMQKDLLGASTKKTIIIISSVVGLLLLIGFIVYKIKKASA